jgi:hypothetical protein
LEKRRKRGANTKRNRKTEIERGDTFGEEEMGQTQKNKKRSGEKIKIANRFLIS